MKVINFEKTSKINSQNLIMGTFDAIHIGHWELIKKSQELKGKTSILIFDKPENLPNKSGEYFESLNIRLQKLANLKIDYAIVIKANDKTISTSPEKFIKDLKKYGFENIIVGKDFRFGSKAKGDATQLKKHFKVLEIDMKKISNKKISSSIIKEQIPFGEISFCNSLTLGPWTTDVQILKNNEFKLPEKQVKPHSGIYATTFIQNDVMYHGIVHVTRKHKMFIKSLNNKSDWQNKNISISWWKELLITINDKQDYIKEEQMQQANAFFKNSL